MFVTHFNFSKKNGNRYLFSFEWLAFKIFVFPMTTGAPLAAKFKRIGYFVLMAHANSIVLLGGTTNEGLFSTIFTLKRGVFFNCCEIEVFFQKNYFFFTPAYYCFFLVLTIVIWTTKLNWRSSTEYTDLRRSVERNSFLAFFLNHK